MLFIKTYKYVVCLIALCFCMLYFALTVSSAEQQLPQSSPPRDLTLVKAVMCEKIEDYVPVNPAIVFSTSLEGISCFTYFDPVPEESVIFHNWYFRDRLSTRIKLSLQPPRWSTFSSIRLRQADKGLRAQLARPDISCVNQSGQIDKLRTQVSADTSIRGIGNDYSAWPVS